MVSNANGGHVKVMVVVGARPNFMKAAPILKAIDRHNRSVLHTAGGSDESQGLQIDPVLVHTGQHYDAAMSDQFFLDLNMRKPDLHLEVGSGSHAVQTAEIMKKFDLVLLAERPDALLVVGDVNSTIACALVASKISFDGDGARPLIVHVEAGLRSFDRTMPEECNRVLTDHLADLLFVTEPSGRLNLQAEGISDSKVFFVGNTMIDTLLAFQDRAENPEFLVSLGLGQKGNGKPYALLTLHRPANVDNRAAFVQILDGLSELAAEWPVVFPVHPRTKKRIEEFGLGRLFADASAISPGTSLKPGFHTTGPLGYLNFVCLMKNAGIVVTDSGGIQEETTCLGVPCVTVRENTERPVTIEQGTNILAGVSSEGIREAIRRHRSISRPRSRPEKWDGQSAVRIVDVLVDQLGRRSVEVPRTPASVPA